MIKEGKLHCVLYYRCLSDLTDNMFYLLSLDWQLSQIRNRPRDRQTSGYVWGTFAEMFQWGGKTRAWHHLVRRRWKWAPTSTALLLTAHAMCWFPQTSVSASASSWTLHSNCEPNKTLLPCVLFWFVSDIVPQQGENQCQGPKIIYAWLKTFRRMPFSFKFCMLPNFLLN